MSTCAPVLFIKVSIMSNNDINRKALEYHSAFPAGKLEVKATKPLENQEDLSLAYTPGVAAPCLEIQEDYHKAYRYTSKGNLVAVITNGTAVLGLGNIGALAGKPVMEGKSVLFKKLSGIDAIDIEVDATDIDEFCRTVRNIAPTFGGINLEDIKAPECFEIEKRLREELHIPLMHDDQHGTAIISAAALVNALEIAGKHIGDVKMVVSGAGAAAIACTRMYVSLGLRSENVVMCDSKGVVRADRTDLNEYKREFATTRDLHTLAEAMAGADVFVGFSKGGTVTQDMVRSMGSHPVIIAMANPVPEIGYCEAKEARPDAIMATGRSDTPNQVNNVSGFPYIFRGALDTWSSAINEEMKHAAVKALAELAKEPVPDPVLKEYGLKELHYGPEYIIPKALDPRLLVKVSTAVAKAAISSGVAHRTITDWDAYAEELRRWMEVK